MEGSSLQQRFDSFLAKISGRSSYQTLNTKEIRRSSNQYEYCSWSTQRRLFSEYYAHQVSHRNEKSRLNKEVYSMKRTSYRALSLSLKDNTNDLPTWIKTTLTFFSKWFHKQILPVNSPHPFFSIQDYFFSGGAVHEATTSMQNLPLPLNYYQSL